MYPKLSPSPTKKQKNKKKNLPFLPFLVKGFFLKINKMKIVNWSVKAQIFNNQIEVGAICFKLANKLQYILLTS